MVEGMGLGSRLLNRYEDFAELPGHFFRRRLKQNGEGEYIGGAVLASPLLVELSDGAIGCKHYADRSPLTYRFEVHFRRLAGGLD